MGSIPTPYVWETCQCPEEIVRLIQVEPNIYYIHVSLQRNFDKHILIILDIGQAFLPFIMKGVYYHFIVFLWDLYYIIPALMIVNYIKMSFKKRINNRWSMHKNFKLMLSFSISYKSDTFTPKPTRCATNLLLFHVTFDTKGRRPIEYRDRDILSAIGQECQLCIGLKKKPTPPCVMSTPLFRH